SRRRHTRCYRDWSSDVCSSDLPAARTIITAFYLSCLFDEESTHVQAPESMAPQSIPPAAGQCSGSQAPGSAASGNARRALCPGRSEERRVGKEGRGGRGAEACM